MGTEKGPLPETLRSHFSRELEKSGKVPPLLTVKDAATRLGLRAERLEQLARDGFAPCIRIDDGTPLFYIRDLRPWVEANLIKETLPRPIPILCVAMAEPVVNDLCLPDAIKPIPGLKRHLTSVPIPCIYFLCKDRQVIYIGQTVNLVLRVGQHYDKKAGEFDAVFYVPVPRERLTEVESAFIRVLRTPTNGGQRKEFINPPSENDKKIVAEYMTPQDLKDFSAVV